MLIACNDKQPESGRVKLALKPIYWYLQPVNTEVYVPRLTVLVTAARLHSCKANAPQLSVSLR